MQHCLPLGSLRAHTCKACYDAHNQKKKNKTRLGDRDASSSRRLLCPHCETPSFAKRSPGVGVNLTLHTLGATLFPLELSNDTDAENNRILQRIEKVSAHLYLQFKYKKDVRCLMQSTSIKRTEWLFCDCPPTYGPLLMIPRTSNNHRVVAHCPLQRKPSSQPSKTDTLPAPCGKFLCLSKRQQITYSDFIRA